MDSQDYSNSMIIFVVTDVPLDLRREPLDRPETDIRAHAQTLESALFFNCTIRSYVHVIIIQQLPQPASPNYIVDL